MLSKLALAQPIRKSLASPLLTRCFSTNFVPLGDRVLVKRMEKATQVVAESQNFTLLRPADAQQTAGGVYLPEANTKKEARGEVIAVGPGGRDANGSIIAPTVAVGDTVLLPEYGGSKLDLSGEEYDLFRNDDILGKFN